MNAQIQHYQDKLSYETDSWDLNTAIQNGEQIVVIDTRSPEAFAEEHIPGAVNFPHRNMSAETTAHLDREVLYVTYCDASAVMGQRRARLKWRNSDFA